MTDRTSGKEEQVNGSLTCGKNKCLRRSTEESNLILNSFVAPGSILSSVFFFFFAGWVRFTGDDCIKFHKGSCVITLGVVTCLALYIESHQLYYYMFILLYSRLNHIFSTICYFYFIALH